MKEKLAFPVDAAGGCSLSTSTAMTDVKKGKETPFPRLALLAAIRLQCTYASRVQFYCCIYTITALYFPWVYILYLRIMRHYFFRKPCII